MLKIFVGLSLETVEYSAVRIRYLSVNFGKALEHTSFGPRERRARDFPPGPESRLSSLGKIPVGFSGSHLWGSRAYHFNCGYHRWINARPTPSPFSHPPIKDLFVWDVNQGLVKKKTRGKRDGLLKTHPVGKLCFFCKFLDTHTSECNLELWSKIWFVVLKFLARLSYCSLSIRAVCGGVVKNERTRLLFYMKCIFNIFYLVWHRL